jgi:NAD(P) transhydrogenase
LAIQAWLAAYDQGRIAAQALVKGEASAHLIEDIPTGIYTIPEISSVGKTEQQLTAMKVPYEVGAQLNIWRGRRSSA